MTHTINNTWSNGNASVAASKSATAEGEANLDVVIPAMSTTHVLWQMTLAQLKLLFFLCKTGVLTIKTNSSGSPVNTFTLAAGIPFSWVTGDPALHDTANGAVTTDITSLYVVNGTAGDLTLNLRALYDPTP